MTVVIGQSSSQSFGNWQEQWPAAVAVGQSCDQSTGQSGGKSSGQWHLPMARVMRPVAVRLWPLARAVTKKLWLSASRAMTSGGIGHWPEKWPVARAVARGFLANVNCSGQCCGHWPEQWPKLLPVARAVASGIGNYSNMWPLALAIGQSCGKSPE